MPLILLGTPSFQEDSIDQFILQQNPDLKTGEVISRNCPFLGK
jgi:hypothetical protein